MVTQQPPKLPPQGTIGSTPIRCAFAVVDGTGRHANLKSLWEQSRERSTRSDGTFALVAGTADAADLKSVSPLGEYGFKSRRAHFLLDTSPCF